MSCGNTYFKSLEDRRWMYWYDRSIRSWAVQELDEDGYQVDRECDYFPRKSEMLDAYPAFTSFTPEPEHLKFTISMELLKHWIQKGKRWKVMGIRMQYANQQISEYLSESEWDDYQDLVDMARESL